MTAVPIDAAAATATGPRDFLVAIDAYADYLRVERGLAAATIRAYDSDLRLFGRGASRIDAWATSPEPARDYLASMTRPPRTLRPTSVRRKAASIRAFYRFCYSEELIEPDIAALIDLPRQMRRLPDTLDSREVAELLEAIPTDDTLGLRDRALLELLYASGLRVSEALHLDRGDGPAPVESNGQQGAEPVVEPVEDAVVAPGDADEG